MQVHGCGVCVSFPLYLCVCRRKVDLGVIAQELSSIFLRHGLSLALNCSRGLGCLAGELVRIFSKDSFLSPIAHV